ncbi:hypothetical protein HK100_009599 [Physocladia obscura]|uniref:Uncharacterized protein n=1 Tax=Physocladia obscura TaxID=109957 RepID=A0AAD5T3R0_9FUNG|nr:hypothetical protein HK100_009599 [Physocladia obscura]
MASALTFTQLLSASTVAGSFFFVGDVAAQLLAGPPKQANAGLATAAGQTLIRFKDWDQERTLKMSLFGIGVNGWYFLTGFHILDRIFGPAKTLKVATTKAVVNQIMFSPPYLTAFLLYSAAFVRPEKGVDPWDTVVTKFPGLYATAWSVWPAVNVISFKFVPPGLARVAFMNATGLLWSSYMVRVGAAKSSSVDEIEVEYAL